MTPLVVRAQPQGQRLAQLLRQQGHQPLCCPLFETTAGADLAQLPALLKDAQVVIAVSAHAVDFARSLLRDHHNYRHDCQFAAVGHATYHAFARIGINALYPDDPRSEGLLLLPQLTQVAGKKIVILRGDGGRELLANTLASRGALVHYCETYSRRYLELDGAALTHQWQQAGLDSLLITSGELLQRLLMLVPRAQTWWLLQLTLVVPSPRVAQLAQQAGFIDIIIAQGASNQALLAALELRKIE